jgi:hypothetical protein
MKAPPERFEQSSNLPGNNASSESRAAFSGAVAANSDFARLAAVWPCLSQEQRRAILRLAGLIDD